jgi:broad specificity phosphatase PhoE
MSQKEPTQHSRSVKLWFVRHGQASFGKEDYDCLSPVGIQQSRVLGEYFKSSGLDFDALYSGEMKRQRDTADLIIDKQPHPSLPLPTILSEFNEYDFMSIFHDLLPGVMDELGLPANTHDNIQTDRHSFQKLFNIIYTRWVAGNHNSADIESYRQYISRIQKGLLKVVENSQSGQNIGIFTSGGVINAVMQMALGLSDEMATALGWRIRNASVSLFTTHKNKTTEQGSRHEYRLMTFNSTAHLDLQGDPALITYR